MNDDLYDRIAAEAGAERAAARAEARREFRASEASEGQAPRARGRETARRREGAPLRSAGRPPQRRDPSKPCRDESGWWSGRGRQLAQGDAEALQALKVRVLTASWKDGKGIDDALVLGRAIKVS